MQFVKNTNIKSSVKKRKKKLKFELHLPPFIRTVNVTSLAYGST